MKEAIQQAVYLVRLCVPVKYKNFRDLRSESNGEILIVDFPLEQWTDTVSNEFRKQFGKYDGEFVETLKHYAESNYNDFVFSNADTFVLMGVLFHDTEHIRRLVEVLARLQQPNQSPTAQPSEQATPPAVQPDADSDTTTEPSGIDTEALKALFIPVFFAPDFKQRDTLNGAINLSRFDIFIEQLESLLSDAQCDKKRIGNVAYMVHKSRFAKNQYKRRGKFAQTCRLLFECCQREAPKDTHPNKYEQPDSNILQHFSDALGNPLNPQK